MLVLIGLLDAGFVLPFLPAEMAFTWKAYKHFLLAGQPLAHPGEPEQLSSLLQPRQPFRSICFRPVITLALFVSVIVLS